MDLRLLNKPDLDKAKNIVCALVGESGGRFEGKTRLNKAFWRAHVYHSRKKDGFLSRYPIARLPEGPAIDDLDDLLVALEREGRVKIEDQSKGDYLECVVTLLSAPPKLESDEAESVREAVAWVKGKSAVQVSRESHRLSRAWQKGSNGDTMDLAFDALDENDAAAIGAELDAIRDSLKHVGEEMAHHFG